MKKIYGVLVALIVLGSFAYLGAMEEKVAISPQELKSGMEVYIGLKEGGRFLSADAGKIKFSNNGTKFFVDQREIENFGKVLWFKIQDGRYLNIKIDGSVFLGTKSSFPMWRIINEVDGSYLYCNLPGEYLGVASMFSEKAIGDYLPAIGSVERENFRIQIFNITKPRELLVAINQENVSDVESLLAQGSSLIDMPDLAKLKQCLFHMTPGKEKLWWRLLVQIFGNEKRKDISQFLHVIKDFLTIIFDRHDIQQLISPHDIFSHEGRSLLDEVAISGDSGLMTLFIESKDKFIKGINLNLLDKTGLAPLHYAVWYERISLVKILLAAGANQGVVASDGKTPLDYAIEKKNQVIQDLLQPGSLSASSFVEKELMFGGNSYYPLILIVDNGSAYAGISRDELDGLLKSLPVAITQRVAPIIVSAPVLYQFFLHSFEPAPGRNGLQDKLRRCIDNPLDVNLKKIVINEYNALPDGMNLLQVDEEDYLKSLIPFNDDLWKIYKSAQDNFYLLMPIDQEKSLSGQFDYPGQSINFPKNIQDLGQFKQTIDINVHEITDFLKPSSGYWNLYLNGHGVTGASIAGMSVRQFQDLLTFLSVSVYTSFLYYVTCFGGGINLVTPYFGVQNKYNYPFIIAQQATTEDSSAATSFCTPTFMPIDPSRNRFKISSDQNIPEPLKRVKVSIDFGEFFQKLEKFFKKENLGIKLTPTEQTQRNQLLEEKSNGSLSLENSVLLDDLSNRLDFWRYILSRITLITYKKVSSNTPLIRFKGSDFFKATDLGEAVMILTEVLKKAAKFEHKDIIVKNREAFLVYPYEIDSTIDIQGRIPKIVSMNPEAAAHTFSYIKANTFKMTEVLKAFIGDLTALSFDAPIKLFIIKKMLVQSDKGDGKEITLENVVISRSPASEIYILRDGKYYRAIITEETQGQSVYSFSEITKNFYDNAKKLLLTIYKKGSVAMKKGGGLVAQWQIEPAEHVEKINKFLDAPTSKIIPEAPKPLIKAKNDGSWLKSDTSWIKHGPAQRAPQAIEVTD